MEKVCCIFKGLRDVSQKYERVLPMRKRRVFDEVSLWALVFLSHSIGRREGMEVQKRPLQCKDLFLELIGIEGITLFCPCY